MIQALLIGVIAIIAIAWVFVWALGIMVMPKAIAHISVTANHNRPLGRILLQRAWGAGRPAYPTVTASLGLWRTWLRLESEKGRKQP